MNKLMKFCGKCEEGFADRFSFCPNCGGELQVFEMSPVSAPKAEAPEIAAPEAPAILAAESAGDVLDIPEFEKPEFETVESAASGINAAPDQNARVYSLADETPAETPAQPAAVKTPAASAAATAASTIASPKGGWREVKSLVPADDGFYHLTMVPNKTFLNDPRLRATGIFGLVLVTTICLGAIVYDLFQQNVFVANPDSDDLALAIYPLSDEVPEMEKIEEEEKGKASGGGGGGGGRKDPTPASEGRLAPQFKTPPLLTPSQEDIRVSDPALKVWRSTQGPKEVIPDNNGKPLGLGANKIPGFDGGGDGTGQGGGTGGGQGPSRGGGAGLGTDGGMGGPGSGGYGPGGPGGGGRPDDDAPEMPKGPTVGVKLLSQPKPPYTEEARKNQINGTVVLKVTFNANGTIGSITPVRSLGYGLTEQAIAAARNIRFEPAKRGGVPYTIAKPIQYTFTLY